MKNQISTAILFAFMCSTSFAAPKSGYGSRTVREASGRAKITNIGSSSLVYIFGEAAEQLFSSLKVRVQIPGYSRSQIKDLGNVSCTKNPDETHCVIGVEHR